MYWALVWACRQEHSSAMPEMNDETKKQKAKIQKECRNQQTSKSNAPAKININAFPAFFADPCFLLVSCFGLRN